MSLPYITIIIIIIIILIIIIMIIIIMIIMIILMIIIILSFDIALFPYIHAQRRITLPKVCYRCYDGVIDVVVIISAVVIVCIVDVVFHIHLSYLSNS